MSSKDTKGLVKDIRAAIKAENYGDAIHKCQRLLKAEPKNYTAYLLLGAAYQNNDKGEAVKYLRKAIQYCNQGPPIVALQGLASCAPLEELPEILGQLIEFVPEKKVEYMERLYTLANNETIAQKCFDIFKEKVKQNNIEALEYVARMLHTKEYEIGTDDVDVYKSAMELCIHIYNGEKQHLIYKRYLKWLWNHNELATCFEISRKMATAYASDVYPYEWICKIYCENYKNPLPKDWFRELQNCVQSYADKLLALNPNSGLGLLVKALELNKIEQYIASRKLLRQSLIVQPNYQVSLELLAETQMRLGAYIQAAALWEQLGGHEEEYAICLSFDYSVKQLKRAAQILRKVTPNTRNQTALARCLFKLEEKSELAALKLSPLAQAEFQMSPAEGLEFLDVNQVEPTFDCLLLRSKLLYALGKYSDSLVNVLKAARLIPCYAECFDYLGRIYCKIGDEDRSRKCYEKCINLNELNESAVYALSDIYQKQNEDNLNEELLQSMLQYAKVENSVKLHYKLALNYMQAKKWDNAIYALRTAIKYDNGCLIYWESLGDAYVSRGSYNSAIRVFQKILEMQPNNIYAQLQIALIKTTTYNFVEAIEHFDKLFKQQPNYLPGLKGAAEAHLGIANNLKLQNLYGRSKDHLQQAANYLQTIMLDGKAHDMVWMWRLIASTFLQTALLPTSLANLDVSGDLAKREDEEVAFLTRKDLLHLAISFYTCALKLKQNTYLWYELALCCYYSANYIPEEYKTHIGLAEKACKMSIKMQNSRWQNWNLLGIINMHDGISNLALAQHCFIYALNIDRKSYTTWGNLGALYMKLNDMKLANHAFQRAQRASPIYTQAWIGQAMVAENIAESEEAIDLLRHCQEHFYYHPEAALGYAYWICTALSEPQLKAKRSIKIAIERMHADILALDAINWYLRNEEDVDEATLPALTYQAFLNVRLKLYGSARNALERAIKIADTDTLRDKLLNNLGYVYLRMKQPDNALIAFNSVKHVTFKPIIGLALSYYRLQHHQEAYSVYNSLLNNLNESHEDKAASILVAMCSMVYSFQGESDARTVLYQSLLSKNRPVQAIFAACALNVLHYDRDLTAMVMTELKPLESLQVYSADIAFIKAQYYLQNYSKNKALSYLTTRVRMFPTSVALRQILCTFLLENFYGEDKYQTATGFMALSALLFGHKDIKKISDPNKNAETLLMASKAIEPLQVEFSVLLIQRAMRLIPLKRDIWMPLIKTLSS